ncbi:hypothetical protein CapIbe_012731 [Capra ibex]
MDLLSSQASQKLGPGEKGGGTGKDPSLGQLQTEKRREDSSSKSRVMMCPPMLLKRLITLDLLAVEHTENPEVVRTLHLPGSPSDCLEHSAMSSSIEHVD